MIVLDTLGKLHSHGHGLFGWCIHCGSASRYWNDVRAGRAPKPAMFDIDLAALIRERGEGCHVVGISPVALSEMPFLKYRDARHFRGSA
jgi:hypothetical protein